MKLFLIDRSVIWVHGTYHWPHINRDIEALIRSCEKCQEHSKRNPKDPSIPREIPLASWTLLEIDIFTCEDHQFLLVVDVSSRFPVVRFAK